MQLPPQIELGQRAASSPPKLAAPGVQCSVCFETEKVVGQMSLVRPCGRSTCPELFCKSCLGTFFTGLIVDSFGVCRTMKCPGCRR